MDDYSEGIAHIVKSDRTLADVLAQIGPCKLSLRTGSVFESLVRAIAHQQLTGRAANTILRRLQDALGTSGSVAPETVLQAGMGVLRRVGSSLAKASYTRELALAVTSGAGLPSPPARPFLER